MRYVFIFFILFCVCFFKHNNNTYTHHTLQRDDRKLHLRKQQANKYKESHFVESNESLQDDEMQSIVTNPRLAKALHDLNSMKNDKNTAKSKNNDTNDDDILTMAKKEKYQTSFDIDHMLLSKNSRKIFVEFFFIFLSF